MSSSLCIRWQKNRLLAIKDSQTGKLLARYILRLLLNESENSPIVFQERIYPDICPQDYKKILDSLAKERAKNLGIDLYTLNDREDISKKNYCSLRSLGSASPYEYIDACSGIEENGQFTIKDSFYCYEIKRHS